MHNRYLFVSRKKIKKKPSASSDSKLAKHEAYNHKIENDVRQLQEVHLQYLKELLNQQKLKC